MGKRSDFKRNARDFYPTPEAAVAPLIPHLSSRPNGWRYWEPCAGELDLVRHLSKLTKGMAEGVMPSDIKGGQGVHQADALTISPPDGIDYIITNPPWDRKLLHPMIERFSKIAPTWLLFDADWMHTKQSSPFTPYLRRIVSVGRVKWIPDSKMTGKDNCCWYLFGDKRGANTRFIGRAGS